MELHNTFIFYKYKLNICLYRLDFEWQEQRILILYVVFKYTFKLIKNPMLRQCYIIVQKWMNLS